MKAMKKVLCMAGLLLGPALVQAGDQQSQAIAQIKAVALVLRQAPYISDIIRPLGGFAVTIDDNVLKPAKALGDLLDNIDVLQRELAQAVQGVKDLSGMRTCINLKSASFSLIAKPTATLVAQVQNEEAQAKNETDPQKKKAAEQRQTVAQQILNAHNHCLNGGCLTCTATGCTGSKMGCTKLAVAKVHNFLSVFRTQILGETGMMPQLFAIVRQQGFYNDILGKKVDDPLNSVIKVLAELKRILAPL